MQFNLYSYDVSAKVHSCIFMSVFFMKQFAVLIFISEVLQSLVLLSLKYFHCFKELQ